MARRSESYSTAITALTGGAVTLEISGVDVDKRHCYAAVDYYSDAAGTPATPGAGTETYTYKTSVQPNAEQSAGAALNSADQVQISWTTPTTYAKCVLAGVTVATHVRLRLIASES
jgi:hypothetical protein